MSQIMIQLDTQDLMWKITFSTENTQVFSQLTKIYSSEDNLSYFLFDIETNVKINLSKDDALLIEKLMKEQINEFRNRLG
jgi:hypothetical protein